MIWIWIYDNNDHRNDFLKHFLAGRNGLKYPEMESEIRLSNLNFKLCGIMREIKKACSSAWNMDIDIDILWLL